MTTIPTASMPTWTVGDTLPPLSGALTYDNGAGRTPISGAGVTAEAHVRMPDRTVLTRPVSVDLDGIWSLAWQPGDLTVAGLAKVEVQVTFPGGGIETFGPSSFTIDSQIA